MSYTVPQPPRAVASTPLPPAPTTALAEEAGKCGIFHCSSPVFGIDPVDGWQMREVDFEDGDGFVRPMYTARRDGVELSLHTCRFRFTPSQERFAWLVRNNFPTRKGKILGPWDDTDIEARLAGECA